MTKYENQHRRLAHRGRQFHFISYAAHDADLKKKIPAMPAMWYLESSGHRWPAIPQLPDQPETELDVQLAVWLEGYVFCAWPPPPAPPEPAAQRFLRPEWLGVAPN